MRCARLLALSICGCSSIAPCGSPPDLAGVGELHVSCDGGAPIDVRGMIGGLAYSAIDAVWEGRQFSSCSYGGGRVCSTEVDVAVADFVPDCHPYNWSGGPVPLDARGIILIALKQTVPLPDTLIVAPATFVVGPGEAAACKLPANQFAWAYATLTVPCGDDWCPTRSATAGWVSLSSVAPVEGVFELEFEGDKVAGRFRARSCP